MCSGSNDVYCTISVAGDIQSTSTLVGAGKHPIWNAGHGEVLFGDKQKCNARNMYKMHGFRHHVRRDWTGSLVAKQVLDAFQYAVATVAGKKGKSRGRIQVQFEWIGQPSDPVNRKIDITVLQARLRK